MITLTDFSKLEIKIGTIIAVEKVAGAELLKYDKFIAKLNKSGSVTEASTNKRKAEVAKFKAGAELSAAVE